MRICHQIISARKEGKQNQGKHWWEGNCNLVLTRVGRTSLTGTSLSLLPKPPSTTCHRGTWWVPHEYVGATWVYGGCHMGADEAFASHLPHGRCPASSDLFVLHFTIALQWKVILCTTIYCPSNVCSTLQFLFYEVISSRYIFIQVGSDINQINTTHTIARHRGETN